MNDTCPKCGYCPNCGRGIEVNPYLPVNPWTQPYYPLQPIWIAPIYPQSPSVQPYPNFVITDTKLTLKDGTS